ncbi:MAG: DNRLRE domain-containing protein [Saprospiraceae bacterium]|nr:DNRLRE domain-containing protein [Saprospiraceae bacterium]
MRNFFLFSFFLFIVNFASIQSLSAQDNCQDRSLRFDGADDFLISNFCPVASNGDFTIEAWVRSTATETGCSGTYRRILSFGGVNTRFEIGDCSGEFNIFWYDGISYAGPVAIPGTNLRDGSWHHVAATRQGSLIQAYYDGALVYSDNTLSSWNILQFRVGKWGGGDNNQEWKGEIDEVRVWQGARSAGDITADMSCKLTGQETGLALYYDFNQGIPFGNNTGLAVVEDITSNNNDGTWSPGFTSTGFSLFGTASNFVCPGAPVKPCARPCTRTITLQPDSTSGKDAFVHELYPGQNFGSNPQFFAMQWTFGGTPAILREYFDFDLSGVPVGATVTSAKLDLFGLIQPNGSAHSCLSGSNDAWISRVTSPWNENTITWNTQPGITSIGQINVPPMCTGGTDLIGFDITSMIQDIVNNPSANFGLQMSLQLENFYRALIYNSSDSPDANRRPRLTVTYIVDCPCEKEFNLVQNGSFSEGFSQGNLGTGGTLSNWQTVSATPQVISHDSCYDAGAIQMWGNQVVGESVGQTVNFVAGKQYKVQFCGMWMPTVQDNVRIRFRASNGAPGSYNACSGTCDEIFLSPVMGTSWNTFTSPVWTATQNFNYLTVSIWNDFAINDGAYVSWARVDDICISVVDSTTTATHDAPTTGSSLEAVIAPNPTTGDFNLYFDQAPDAEMQGVIMDITGRVIEQVTIQPGNNNPSLSLSQHPSGLYIVRVFSKGQAVWTGKVIKE